MGLSPCSWGVSGPSRVVSAACCAWGYPSANIWGICEWLCLMGTDSASAGERLPVHGDTGELLLAAGECILT